MGEFERVTGVGGVFFRADDPTGEHLQELEVMADALSGQNVSVRIGSVRAAASFILPLEPARGALAELDPNLPMFRVRTMEQFAANAVAQPRLYLTLLGLFAIALATALGWSPTGVLSWAGVAVAATRHRCCRPTMGVGCHYPATRLTM